MNHEIHALPYPDDCNCICRVTWGRELPLCPYRSISEAGTKLRWFNIIANQEIISRPFGSFRCSRTEQKFLSFPNISTNDSTVCPFGVLELLYLLTLHIDILTLYRPLGLLELLGPPRFWNLSDLLVFLDLLDLSNSQWHTSCRQQSCFYAAYDILSNNVLKFEICSTNESSCILRYL